YYRRGHEQGVESDFGYNSINAAYILDLLAYQEQTESQKSNTSSTYADDRRADAAEIRREVIRAMTNLAAADSELERKWWFLATIAEAHFGLSQCDETLTWLNKARALDGIAEWEKQSTTRQLARLANIQSNGNVDKNLAIQTLRTFLDGNDAAVQSVFAGK